MLGHFVNLPRRQCKRSFRLSRKIRHFKIHHPLSPKKRAAAFQKPNLRQKKLCRKNEQRIRLVSQRYRPNGATRAGHRSEKILSWLGPLVERADEIFVAWQRFRFRQRLRWQMFGNSSCKVEMVSLVAKGSSEPNWHCR